MSRFIIIIRIEDIEQNRTIECIEVIIRMSECVM